MDLGLKDKVAIVTGGSFGIGRGAAEAFAQEGARVALVARNQEDLDRVAGEISAATGADVVGISTDVTIESQVQAMVEKVVERWGRADILVNNAGSGNANAFDDVTDEILSADLQLKVFGAVYCMRAVLPHMRAAGGGAVVNITTPAGKATGAASQPTALSRAAGISLTKAWSKEFAQRTSVSTRSASAQSRADRTTSTGSVGTSRTLLSRWRTTGKSGRGRFQWAAAARRTRLASQSLSSAQSAPATSPAHR